MRHISHRAGRHAAFAFLLLGLAALAAASTLPASRQAQIVLVSGTVRVDGKLADIGQSLNPVALIETGPASRCDIVFGGGNAVSFSQNTRARIDFNSPAISLRLEWGGVTSVLKKLEKLVGRTAFDISTPQTLAGVRGTSFCVWCAAGETYVCACNGRVHFEDQKGGNVEDLASAHHAGRIYEERNGKIVVVKAGVLHHDDASVESVAKDIGYTIDWSRLDE
ncbi:MAG TPA: FecR family protein [Rectinemataceae bacterium]|nr:FecR family protein [Rectinemataceae bacterium]